MQRAIDVTNRHREKQIRYNMEHGIVPRQIVKSTDAILGTTGIIEHAAEVRNAAEKDPVSIYKEDTLIAAEPRAEYGSVSNQAIKQSSNQAFLAMTKEQLRKEIRDRQRKMQLAAKELDFLAAAKFRDEIKELQSLLDSAR